MKSFIVNLWKVIFRFLRWISVFQILRHIFPKDTKNHRFVDWWVLSNFILSFLSIFIVGYEYQKCLVWALIFWGSLRIFEILVYQVNVLFFDLFESTQELNEYALGGYRRIIILSLHNYFEIVFWFTSFYLYLKAFFLDPHEVLKNWAGSLYYSVVTITTLGYGEVTPNNDWTRLLVALQTAIGVFMVIVIIARFISFLPKPKTLDNKEQTETDDS